MVSGLQRSVVQASPSSQTETAPVQQGLKVGRLTQPASASQRSMVHWLKSLQVLGLPPPQRPSLQVVSTVQGSLSSQLAVLKEGVQPEPSTQTSSVQSLPSSQTTGAPSQRPRLQTSPLVQPAPSSQATSAPSGTGR